MVPKCQSQAQKNGHQRSRQTTAIEPTCSAGRQKRQVVIRRPNRRLLRNAHFTRHANEDDDGRESNPSPPSTHRHPSWGQTDTPRPLHEASKHFSPKSFWRSPAPLPARKV